jgi:dTDP-glucose 4,6-dehydratase/UDP-glucose 4-epimerase
MRVRDARQTFLGIWIRNVIQGAPVLVYGGGTQLRDFNYVEDAVDALLAAAVDPKSEGQVFNLGSAEVISLKAVAEKIISLNGSGRYESVPFPPERKAIDIGDYYSDFTKIRTELSWVPKVSLDEGLKRTLDYFSKYGSHYWSNA